MRTLIATTLLLATASAGCSFMARGEDQYRNDTRSLLETRSSNVRSCYDQHLASNPEASGTVVLNFTVEKKTGELTNINVDPDTSAPEPLQQCVVQAVEGLRLTPEDRRDGEATFTWVFRAPPPAAAAEPAV